MKKIEYILSDIKTLKTILLCGDLNIDLVKHEHHSYAKNFLDLMFNLVLYPLIDKPSRLTDIQANLIDNIFKNSLRHNIT